MQHEKATQNRLVILEKSKIQAATISVKTLYFWQLQWTLSLLRTRIGFLTEERLGIAKWGGLVGDSHFGENGSSSNAATYWYIAPK